jgi:Autographiviridae endonuclease VII
VKRCSTCRQTKPLDQFHRDKNPRDGRARRCKDCAKAEARAWYEDHPEQAKASRQSWQKRNKDRVNELARARYKKDPTRDLNAKLKYRYGVEWTQFEAMALAQGGVCAICGDPPGRSRFHVDHDHATGKVRGLLCGPCNQGIGSLRDDPKIVRAALRYLLKHRP